MQENTLKQFHSSVSADGIPSMTLKTGHASMSLFLDMKTDSHRSANSHHSHVPMADITKKNHVRTMSWCQSVRRCQHGIRVVDILVCKSFPTLPAQNYCGGTLVCPLSSRRFQHKIIVVALILIERPCQPPLDVHQSMDWCFLCL